MNIAVCVKQAVDEAELRVDESGKLVEGGAPAKMSTFDKNAVEEAVRLKASQGGSVTVLTFGSQESKRTMKEALAMGADRGVLVVSDGNFHDTLTTSYYLAEVARQAGPYEIVFCSEGSSDVYTGQVGPMMAEWMSIPFLGYVRKLEMREGRIVCEQSLEDSVEVVESALPAIVSVVSEINEPRFPTLIQIMQASKKPIEERRVDQLRGVDAPVSLVSTGEVKVQSMRRKRVIFEGAAEETAKKLLDALASEGVLRS